MKLSKANELVYKLHLQYSVLIKSIFEESQKIINDHSVNENGIKKCRTSNTLLALRRVQFEVLEELAKFQDSKFYEPPVKEIKGE